MSRQQAQQTMSGDASAVPQARGILQRKCECGAHTPGGGTCESCTVKKKRLQRKHSIGASNDPLEHEADRIAEQVLSGPATAGIDAGPIRVQRFTPYASEQSDHAPESVDRVLASAGRPLDTETRYDMEQRFGHDFSQVRVHLDSAAQQSARDVGAQAYTVGNDIVFGAGRFSPTSSAGRLLLAHELTHVVQQGGAPAEASGTLMRTPVEGGGGGRSISHGGTLPYREAKNLTDCVRIMGPGSEDYCRQEVLGERPTGRTPAGVPTAPTAPAAPCPLSVQGPAEVDHYCAAYVPSDAASCGTFPAPNITLTAQGAAPGATLTWSIVRGGTLASIVGPSNAASVSIKGDAASVARNDVTVSVSNGTCAATKTLTVREPKNFLTVQTPTSGPSFIQTEVLYTVVDQFGAAMGANICIDETITICSRSHPVSPTFGDAGTNASGQARDTLRVAVASGTLPASFCIKLNQSLTAGGCGPLRNNTILFQPSGITLAPGASCAVGDPCP